MRFGCPAVRHLFFLEQPGTENRPFSGEPMDTIFFYRKPKMFLRFKPSTMKQFQSKLWLFNQTSDCPFQWRCSMVLARSNTDFGPADLFGRLQLRWFGWVPAQFESFPGTDPLKKKPAWGFSKILQKMMVFHLPKAKDNWQSESQDLCRMSQQKPTQLAATSKASFQRWVPWFASWCQHPCCSLMPESAWKFASPIWLPWKPGRSFLEGYFWSEKNYIVIWNVNPILESWNSNLRK